MYQAFFEHTLHLPLKIEVVSIIKRNYYRNLSFCQIDTCFVDSSIVQNKNKRMAHGISQETLVC